MKIHFLGTAAAEGWPGIFCNCDACIQAKELGGKNIRTRAGAILDDTIKLDFGPDTYMQSLRDNVDLSQLQYFLFTHTHHDHFIPVELAMYQAGYAWNHPDSLYIYGHDKVIGRAMNEIIRETDQTKFVFSLLQPFETTEIGGFQVTPLRADHDRTETCLIYLFEKVGTTLLWAHDSGYFPDDTWRWLEQHAEQSGPLSGVVLDCTGGPLEGIRNHMGIDGVLLVKARMQEMGMADERTTVVATHFSHNGKLMHHELEARLNPHGVQVAFDGWRLAL